MPMGVVDDAEFESQLVNVVKKNIPSGRSNESVRVPIPESIEGEVVPSNGDHSRGRNKGDVNAPASMRALIGSTANVEGRSAALELGRAFGLSSSSVSAYSKGATSTASYDRPKSGILDAIRNRKTHASKKALRKLHSALDSIEETELSSLSAKHLATIAKDLAGVVKIMTPDEVTSSGPSVVFQLFAPPTRPEAEFDVIQVNEV